jgi:hypothetical protein
MKRLCSLTLATVMVLGALASAYAATEVKMTGDARIYGLYMNNRNFTGWNRMASNKKAKAENFEIWERFRLRADFVANEAVKFRLGLKVEDTWGHGTFTAANPSAAVQVYLAYLQFKWPGSDVEITAGLQPVSLPHSSMFNASPVFSDQMAAMIITAPIIPDTLSVMTGFGRIIENSSDFVSTSNYSNSSASTTTDGNNNAQNLDAYFLAVPITVDGFKVTPWGTVAVAGRDTLYNWKDTTDGATGVGDSFANTLTAPMTMVGGPKAHGTGWKNYQNAYYWVGGAFEVTALDPIRFYADVIYGAGAMSDRKSSQRSGWFADFGVEYTGLDVVTPQVFAWWSTGEDKSVNNGSERMPYMRSAWGPGSSFLFDGGQELNHGGANMFVSPMGNMGIGGSLDKISFIEKLTHRLTFTYVRGTNSATGIRRALVNGCNNLADGYGAYFSMGRDLTWDESLIALNFDTKYQIYENLAAVVETGWAHGTFQRNVWRSDSNGTYHRPDDAWKVAFGLTYKF